MNESLWWVMLAGGVLTYLTRLSFIALEGRYRTPDYFRRALPLVPVAALSALILPDLLLVQGQFAGVTHPRLIAGLIAIAVAWRWKNATLTIVAGFATLWGLQ